MSSLSVGSSPRAASGGMCVVVCHEMWTLEEGGDEEGGGMEERENAETGRLFIRELVADRHG